MIMIKFNDFSINESKVNDDLIDQVTITFAYISDEFDSKIEYKNSEVFIEIKNPQPSSVVYDNFEDYVKKSTKWNEALLDIEVAIKQLTKNNIIGCFTKVNTVSNVILRFYIKNDDLLKSNKGTIILSEYNFNRLIDSNIGELKTTGNRNEFRIYFYKHMTPKEQLDISKKIKYYFTKSGINNVDIEVYNWDIGNMLVKVMEPRNRATYKPKLMEPRNGSRLYKSIEIQNIV